MLSEIEIAEWPDLQTLISSITCIVQSDNPNSRIMQPIRTCEEMSVHEKGLVHSHPANNRAAINGPRLILQLFGVPLYIKLYSMSYRNIVVNRTVFLGRPKSIHEVSIDSSSRNFRYTAAQCIIINLEEEAISCNGLIVV